MKAIRLILSLGFVISMAAGAYAQTNLATIANSGAVLLSEEQPLQSSYDLDASEFNFEDIHAALDHFKNVNTDLVFYRPVPNNGIVKMYLQLNKQPNWTKEDWNNYLAEHKVLSTQTNHSPSK